MPDLARARRRLEATMVDRCTIGRDPQGTRDDTFDYTTGTYTPPAGDLDPIYDGICMVSLAGQAVVGQASGGAGTEEYRRAYQVSIPAAYTARIGDTVTVTECDADADLIGKPLRVRQVQHGTFMARRRLVCELVHGGPPT